MSPNWITILGTVVIAIGAIGTAIAGGAAAYRKFSELAKPAERTADEGPPVGSVEWVTDIQRAMGTAHAACVLDALLSGCSRDKARSIRIEQLESQKPAEPTI